MHDRHHTARKISQREESRIVKERRGDGGAIKRHMMRRRREKVTGRQKSPCTEIQTDASNLMQVKQKLNKQPQSEVLNMPDAARLLQTLTCTHSPVNIFMRYMQNNAVKNPSWTYIKNISKPATGM